LLQITCDLPLLGTISYFILDQYHMKNPHLTIVEH
jgi:hypothetical protein